MKGQNRPLPPPFEMNSGVHREWLALQDELGGIRGKGFSEHQVWKLAIIAEHQADHHRRRLDFKYRCAMQDYRRSFGLPATPPARDRAA